MENTVETIVAAAILMPVPDRLKELMWMGKRQYPDHLIISAPPPARHGTLLHPTYDNTKMHIDSDGQGFLTSTGRYVNRTEAKLIALAAGQPIIRHSSYNDNHPYLFSEDLW